MPESNKVEACVLRWYGNVRMYWVIVMERENGRVN